MGGTTYNSKTLQIYTSTGSKLYITVPVVTETYYSYTIANASIWLATLLTIYFIIIVTEVDVITVEYSDNHQDWGN